MGGWAYGNFSGDTNGEGSLCNPSPGVSGCLLYPTGSTFAISASVVAEYNLSPNVGFRLAPEYFATGFGSTLQNSLRLHGRSCLSLRQAVKRQGTRPCICF